MSCCELTYLKKFVGMNSFDVLYDSDEMPYVRTAFESTITGRKNVAIIIIAEEKYVFGTFVSGCIPQIPYDFEQKTDLQEDESFIFSLKSDQIENPIKFNKNLRFSDELSEQYDNFGENTICIRGYSFFSNYLVSFGHCFGCRHPILNHPESGYLYWKIDGWYYNKVTHELLVGKEQINRSRNTGFKINRLLAIQFN